MRIERGTDSIKIFDADGYEEIAIPRWQTIEEFKVNPVLGTCWIYHKTEESVFISHYEDECFYTDSTSFDAWYEEENIAHVMPIKTPEAPK